MKALFSTLFSTTPAEKVRRLTCWRQLCSSYLPVFQEGSIWRYNRRPGPEDPEQGWKLHVSATVLNAHRVLERIAPLLVERGVQFKAPASLGELKPLNSGLHYSYTQIGKVITVYPGSDEEAAVIAREIHELTRHMMAPSVPFDLRYKAGSNVYYRYGAFRSLEMDLPGGGARVSAVKDPRGNLVPDLYGAENAKPLWAENPFPTRRARATKDNPLKTTFRVFRALSQRGKGGVYQAVDLSTSPPRLCLVKEGRKAGELGWDRRDGRWRVKYEEHVLANLREGGVDVPEVYSSFELAGNYYIVTEFVDGECLQSILMKKKRRLSLARALNYGIQLSWLIAQIHTTGWIWRDCKPTNLILTESGKLRSVDFEGACPIDQPDALPWMSPAFTPPAGRGGSRGRSAVYDDLFALGTVIYLLLTGRMPEVCPPPQRIRKLRCNTPAVVCKLVSELLDPDARHLPDAREVADQLTTALGAP